jgi:L-ornithine Nalpha-acyltransferase
VHDIKGRRRHQTVFAPAYAPGRRRNASPAGSTVTTIPTIADSSAREARSSLLSVPGPRAEGDIAVPGDLYERVGAFEIRLASGAKDLRQTQRLRYRVFYEEGGAIATAEASRRRLDLCPFDAISDHLVVVDTEALSKTGRRKPRIVGTYRLLRRDAAERHNGFYSQGEFDLAPLLARHPQTRFVELGRSCVDAQYRSRRVVELLWRGLWLYVTRHRIDALIGCASLPGTDVAALRLPLSFLFAHCAAEPAWQVEAWPRCRAELEPLPAAGIDARRALMALPPLIKGYLRTGARFATSAVVDRQFGTTDVFTIMPVGDIEERYLAHYGSPSCVSEVPVA